MADLANETFESYLAASGELTQKHAGLQAQAALAQTEFDIKSAELRRKEEAENAVGNVYV